MRDATRPAHRHSSTGSDRRTGPVRTEAAVATTRRSDSPPRSAASSATNLPIAISCYDGSRIGPDDADTTLVVRSPEGTALRAHRAGRDRHRTRVRRRVSSTWRATSSPRSSSAITCPTCASGRATGSSSRRSRACRACARCRHRPKKRACADAGTRRSATPPRSRITTTCRTTSTGSCSDRR